MSKSVFVTFNTSPRIAYASLIVTFGSTGTMLNGRTSIGRGEDSEIVVDHPTVSRFTRGSRDDDGKFFISDTGSRNGTFVDGDVHVRQRLRDGANCVGPARIIFRLAPLSEVGAKASDQRVAKRARGRASSLCARAARGYGFPTIEPANPASECCGGPVTSVRAGSGSRSMPNRLMPTTRRPLASCSICQCEIHQEDRTTCPACGLVFHEECSAENKGCSAYGCAGKCAGG